MHVADLTLLMCGIFDFFSFFLFERSAKKCIKNLRWGRGKEIINEVGILCFNVLEITG